LLAAPTPPAHPACPEQRGHELKNRSCHLDVLSGRVHPLSLAFVARPLPPDERRKVRFLAPAETEFVPRGGNNSWENAGRRELLRRMQEPRRGRPLGPLSDGLSPEMTAWATRLREFYSSLGLTLGEWERLVGIDASTLSRYLNGRRLPEITFLGKLDDAVHSRTRARMQQDVRASVRELYLAACLVHEPQRHEVYRLRSELAEAVERAERAEETVWELRAELGAEQRQRELVESGLRRLEAHTGTPGDLDALRRERAQAIAERDALSALVRQHSAELFSALQEQYAIAQVRSQLVSDLTEAEQVLDEKLETDGESPEPAPRTERPESTPASPRRRLFGRRPRRAAVETLRQETLRVAMVELPDLVDRLRAGEPLEADLSRLSVSTGSDEDIAEVAHAINSLVGEAVRMAAEQAALRKSVNDMFTNLSRRSQSLIQRQLSLISELESREADLDQLSSLFKLDHLATRMRRNGENLLVLAGEEPAHRWTEPAPLVDLLRAAAAEIEQYERIDLTSVPAAEVIGHAISDLVHLLAELLENATYYSPPDTRVRVIAHPLADGRLLIEIHDDGLGLTPEHLADINVMLANPPAVDVSVSRRMGLFVVGRLSARQGIRVQLRPSASGGATALVMLPVRVLHTDPPPPDPPRSSGEPDPFGPPDPFRPA
jgi:transcriptional regulator with XRE-family HTH domain